MNIPEEMKIKYLQRRILDLHKLRNLLDKDDFSLALTLGHQIRGNANTFDLPQMTSIGVEIEEAATRQDKDHLQNLIKKMENIILEAQGQYV